MAHAAAKQLCLAERNLAGAVRGFLKGIWNKQALQIGSKKRVPIGVCVSGGPDSMALAYLLKRVSKADEIRTKPVAFIVNHNARQGSGEEAKHVSSLLQKLGIKSEILEMEWPGIGDPSALPDFEMQARRARYRLIANAAIQRQIRHLFLGHHQDDQIETILMRLIRNSSDSFLGHQGIAEHSTIPCCEDIRGAQTAKENISFEAWLRDASAHRAAIKMPFEAPNVNKGKMIAPSTAGMQIHRPLLTFPKSELVQLCDTDSIPYVLDKTNFDPTLTLRNSIRHLRSNYTIPRALQGSSVLELQRVAQHSAKSLAARGESILKMVRVRSLDLRSGRMTICLTPPFRDTCENDLEAGAYALARLTSVVSPQSKDDDQPTLVSQQKLMDFLEIEKRGAKEQMTMQQVLCQKVESDPSLWTERSTVWTFSRPPMRKRELELTSMVFVPWLESTGAAGKTLTKTEKKYLAEKFKRKGLWSKWLLWDHRYWIRVRTQNAERLSTIRLRTYTESDSTEVYKNLESGKHDFQAMLAEAAPGKARYTLPVLTVDGNVSVFPTFNVMLQRPDQRGPKPGLDCHPIQEWEVCYKILDQSFIKSQIGTIEWRNSPHIGCQSNANE
ncbi:hypothetical protein H2200_003042 [Cladophialophora chaetospira]|uniref:tRNA(Ile)-lysidine synthetase n=1 Tax=Cladophialophora chaetospira TaxID=386627 RepID=A0AA39CMA7_9EURO|nr:hypothetical protein H2200_003042 [Cladophialophora chaetospira]